MRGKPQCLHAGWGDNRITPAYAGKTEFAGQEKTVAADHPRVCGENRVGFASLSLPTGSPPRMRGKLTERNEMDTSRRITPAYAGKTMSHHVSTPLNTDHPRVCGENHYAAQCVLQCTGSPPRMRGKRRYNRIHAGKYRITPAYAGKTISSHKPASTTADHPRVCGENCQKTVLVESCQGSPPRMRGKLPNRGKFRLRIRITPAYAGKTQE